jgi:hypothetical protein
MTNKKAPSDPLFESNPPWVDCPSRIVVVLDRFDAFVYELAFTTLKAARVTARSEIQ